MMPDTPENDQFQLLKKGTVPWFSFCTVDGELPIALLAHVFVGRTWLGRSRARVVVVVPAAISVWTRNSNPQLCPGTSTHPPKSEPSPPDGGARDRGLYAFSAEMLNVLRSF